MYKARNLLLVLCSLAFNCKTTWSQIKSSRPNIIIFMVDDMGWMDSSVPFGDSIMPLNKRFNTPNMECLAKDGVKFVNAYSACVCTPTRASLLSGMNAAHHGITNWTSPTKNKSTDEGDSQMIQANWNVNGLSPTPGIEKTCYATMLPQVLQDAGYYTIHSGKAHWASAGTPGANPINMGFLVNIAGHAAGHPYSYLGIENYGNILGKPQTSHAVPDLEEYFGTDTFLTDALTIKALKALEYPVKRNIPFFLHMAHYAVHTPITADSRYVQKYYDGGLDSTEANYASLIEGMDKSLGDIMGWLRKEGIEHNTVIFFMSDNGGLALSPLRGGKSFTQNLPLKAGKGSVCEGGIREPMIVKWPKVIKPGSVSTQNVIIEDFFPTVLDIAGVKNYKAVQKIDGKSFLSMLRNQNAMDDQRTLVWHFPNKWLGNDAPGHDYFSAIKKGDWKLLYNMRNKKIELYNIKNDIGEVHDLSKQHPEIAMKLARLLSKKLSKWEAPMPRFKENGMRVPYPTE